MRWLCSRSLVYWFVLCLFLVQVLLTERFDEGLAMLQRMLKWDPIDMTYCKMLQTKKGETRWDGKPLENVPKIADLPPEASAALRGAYPCVCVVHIYRKHVLVNCSSCTRYIGMYISGHVFVLACSNPTVVTNVKSGRCWELMRSRRGRSGESRSVGAM